MQIVRKIANWLYCLTAFITFLTWGLLYHDFSSDEVFKTFLSINDVLWIVLPVLFVILAGLFVAVFISDMRTGFPNKKLNVNFIIKYIILGMACVFTVVGRSDRDACLFFVLIGLAYLANFRSILKTSFLYYVLFILSTILMLLFGVFTNEMHVREGVVRWSLGFGHPNAVGLTFVFAFLTVWLLDKKKNTILYTVLAAALAILILVISDSRTAIIGLVLFVVLIWIDKILIPRISCFKLKNVWKYILVVFPVLCALEFIIIGFICRDVPGMDKSTFSMRFYEFPDAIRMHGASIFGRLVYPAEDVYYHFDNLYIKIFFRNGILVFVAFLFLLVLTNRKAIQNRNRPVLILLVIIEIYAMMEQVYYYPLFMILMMYLFVPEESVNIEGQGERKRGIVLKQ